MLTGHTGFKGSWLCVWLTELGAHVTGFALESPTQPAMFELLELGRRIESIYGDVRDLEHMRRVAASHDFDVIIHMAAQALVRESYNQPVATYATNVMGTVHLLQIARECKSVKVVVNVTSDKCYKNNESNHGFKEQDGMGGFDPYSSSKGCAELITMAFRNSFFSPDAYTTHGVAVASARAGNVIGGGDWATDRLIPDMIRAFLRRESVMIRSPHAIRPWQHVLEPLSGYLALAEQLWEVGPVFAEGWNFGPLDSDAKPVSWIADHLVNAWGDGVSWQLDNEDHPHEAHYLRLDINKAQSRLHYQPRLGLSEALSWVVEWYKAYAAQEDLLSVTQAQIKRFETHAI